MPDIKPVYGYPNYSVSSDGVVWSNYTGKPVTEQITKSSPTTKRGTGYHRVELRKNGKPKKFFVHRLVALAFIPNDNPEANSVNHKNGNKSDNSVENLEWVTHRQNVDHAVETGLQLKGEAVGTSIYEEQMVHKACQMITRGDLSLQDISDETGLGYATVSDLKNRRSWKHIVEQYDYDKAKRLPRSRRIA